LLSCLLYFLTDPEITSNVVDFKITHLDGHEEWVEIKVKWIPVATLKVNLFRALFPNRLYRVVKSEGWSSR
jgi:hypothetical protein